MVVNLSLRDDATHSENNDVDLQSDAVEAANTTPPNSVVSQEEEIQKALSKRKYVLQELIDTERDYVNHLGQIIDGYMKLMNCTSDSTAESNSIQVPEDLRNGKDKIIFGNIETIYEFHKE